MLVVFRLTDWLVKRFGSAQKEEALELFQGETRNNMKKKEEEDWLVLHFMAYFKRHSPIRMVRIFHVDHNKHIDPKNYHHQKEFWVVGSCFCLFSSACIKACMREKREKKTTTKITTQWSRDIKAFWVTSHDWLWHCDIIAMCIIASICFSFCFAFVKTSRNEMCSLFIFAE